MENFHYGLSLLNTLYGIDLEEEDYEEIALIAYGLIGNKRMKIYRYTAYVNDCEEGVELPCNVELLEAVTIAGEEWNHTTRDTPNGDMYSAYVESYIEHRKLFRHPLYIPGKYIKYERVGNTLYFDHPHGKILILYRGLVLDDDGLPELTEKEARAIATYCAYITKYKEGIKENDPKMILLAETLRQLWLIQCDQARVGDYINQNAWDEILDAKTNWARKVHHQSFKRYW